MKAEAQEKKKEAGVQGKERGKEGGRGKKKPHVEQIPQGVSDRSKTTSARKTSTLRAKAVGTNRKYLETAEAEDINQGDLSKMVKDFMEIGNLAKNHKVAAERKREKGS
jgi:hypothetical protein